MTLGVFAAPPVSSSLLSKSGFGSTILGENRRQRGRKGPGEHQHLSSFLSQPPVDAPFGMNLHSTVLPSSRT